MALTAKRYNALPAKRTVRKSCLFKPVQQLVIFQLCLILLRIDEILRDIL
ncbi:predicted protein [Brucella sp. 83/13]|nr:predicted protein [Brucella sp. 83/13]